MSLNIKNARTHAMVRELARRTGTSQTGAVERAVARMLAELGPDADDPALAHRLQAARSVVQAYRADLSAEDRRRIQTVDADLYDEAGLPR